MNQHSEIKSVLDEVKVLAKRFKDLSGKPLEITSKVAKFSAAFLLGLELARARTPGYDAIDNDSRKIQIKSRCLSFNPKSGQRLGSIRLDYEWDIVLLVLLDEAFEVLEM